MQIPKGGNAPVKVFFNTEEELTRNEILGLLQFISQACNFNNAVPTRTAKWLGKNQQSLQKPYGVINFEEKPLIEDIRESSNFIEKHTNGANLLWDGVEDDKGKGIFGVKAFINEKNEPINIANGKVLSGEISGKLTAYVIDPEKRKKYFEDLEKYKLLLKKRNEVKVKVRLLKISEDYLEQTNFIFPTGMATEDGPAYFIVVANEYLIDSKGGEPIENGKLKKVEEN